MGCRERRHRMDWDVMILLSTLIDLNTRLSSIRYIFTQKTKLHLQNPLWNWVCHWRTLRNKNRESDDKKIQVKIYEDKRLNLQKLSVPTGWGISPQFLNLKLLLSSTSDCDSKNANSAKLDGIFCRGLKLLERVATVPNWCTLKFQINICPFALTNRPKAYLNLRVAGLEWDVVDENQTHCLVVLDTVLHWLTYVCSLQSCRGTSCSLQLQSEQSDLTPGISFSSQSDSKATKRNVLG